MANIEKNKPEFVKRDGIITDSKNVRSLFLHIPSSSQNKRRNEYMHFGNTYQLYIWQSPF